MTRLLPLLALAAGCTASLNVGGPCKDFDTGEEPCRQQLYFPTGVAVDPDADSNVIYVTSSNADLRYSGGTVAAIDLKRFECALGWAHAGKLPDGEGCDSLLVSLYLKNSNTLVKAGDQAKVFHLLDPDPTDDQNRTVVEADAASCHIDLLDPRVLECDETRFVTSAVKIGNFSGSIRVQGPIGGFDHRLWLPVRGDPSLTFVHVKKPSKSDKNAPSGAILSCPDPQNGDPARRLDSCNAQRVTVRDFHTSCMTDMDCPNGVSCSSGKCATVPLPPEPFGLYLDEGPGYSRLAVSHLLGGEVTLINAGSASPASTDKIVPTDRIVLDVRGGFFPADGSGRRGAFALAPIHPGAPVGTPSYWYVTSRISPSVAMFRVADVNLILPAPGFTAGGGPFFAGDDVRDVVVQPDGARAFFVQNHPPALFTLDTRPQESSQSGYPQNEIVDIVDVCQGPSHLGLRRWTEAGAPGAEDRVVTRVYVVCFTTGQVAVVDPDLATVADTILVGRGPNDIAFNFANDDTTVAHRRAFVTNFTDSTISVIDLERGSSTENRVIARIGVSSPPVGQ
jgi:hypothetical protein